MDREQHDYPQTKAELKKEGDVTREVKNDEKKVAESVKNTVHDAKEQGKELADKAADLALDDKPIKDAVDVFVPSAEQVDSKLVHAQDKLEDLAYMKRHNVDMTEKPKIRQVIDDTMQVIQDERVILHEKSDNKAIGDAVQRTANLAQIAYDQSWEALDKLWSNWTSLLTVVAAGSAGSWKNILEEGGHLINDLRHTKDFIKTLNDLQTIFLALYNRAQKREDVGGKVQEVSKEWESQREVLMKDLQNCYAVLSKSPIWKRIIVQGKAMGTQLGKVAGETKDEFAKVGEVLAESKDLQKLKDDLKGILQAIVGNNGPKVDPFLNYAYAAWDDIIGNEGGHRWAAEIDNLLNTVTVDASKMSQEDYQKQYEALYNSTKDLLDHTVQNHNLRLAMRESRKLIRAVKVDPNNKKLIDDAAKLFKHVTSVKQANLLDPQFMEEIRSVLVPILIDHMDNAPLPDYEGTDQNALGKFHYKLSGIRLGTTGLVPTKVKIEFRYKAVADPSKLEVKQQHMYMYFEVDDIQVAFKDVKWEYERLTTPKVHDNGVLDLATAGKGICFKFKAEIINYQPPAHPHSLSELLEPPKENKMFKIIKADCTIDDFHVNISGASVFYEMLAGVWGSKIKHQIEHQVEAKLRILSDRFNFELYDIVRRATAPSLTSDARDVIFGSGEGLKHVGEKIVETVKDAAAISKQTVKDM